MGLPVEDRLERKEQANPQLAALCRQAAMKIESDAALGAAGSAVAAALYARSGDVDAAMRAYRKCAICATAPGSTNESRLPALAKATAAYHQHRYNDSEFELLAGSRLIPPTMRLATISSARDGSFPWFRSNAS